MWWFFIGDEVALCGKFGGSSIIMGEVVAHYWRCGSSLWELWWLIIVDVVAPCGRCGGSLLEIWWLIMGYVVAHNWRCGSSLLEV